MVMVLVLSSWQIKTVFLIKSLLFLNLIILIFVNFHISVGLHVLTLILRQPVPSPPPVFNPNSTFALQSSKFSIKSFQLRPIQNSLTLLKPLYSNLSTKRQPTFRPIQLTCAPVSNIINNSHSLVSTPSLGVYYFCR